MGSQKELRFAYGLAIVLFVVGAFSYAAFSRNPPDPPLRMMYKVAVGNVLFDHKTHADVPGVGLTCKDCHHHPLEEDTDTRACGDCHLVKESKTPAKACLDCHEADEIEDQEMLKEGDAFHAQCISCHQDFGAGPVECAGCHTK